MMYYRCLRAVKRVSAQLTLGTNNLRQKSSAASTVFALSSGSGKCGVAVIRVSGPNAAICLQQFCGNITKPRMATVRRLRNPYSKEILDKALVLWFPGPQSFTGEDCVEFHVHGGPAVITSVLTALGTVEGLKPAQAGDFTKQAFINGKLDLTEIEGLGDLIHAETEAQRKQALRQMEGELGEIYAWWRTTLIKCLANTEAFIDFHEEENIEDNILDSVSSEVIVIQKDISEHLNDSRRGERLRDGVHVVILGEPNVGKSSLLNAICQRPAAIVSPIAGTTRDIVETALNISGYPVLLSDTAGLRETSDLVEKEGVSRAVERAKSADIMILMLDFEKHFQQLDRGSISVLNEFVESYMIKFGLFPNCSGSKISLSNSDACPSSQQKHLISTSSGDTEELSKEKHNRNRLLEISKNFQCLDHSDVLIALNKCDLVQNPAFIGSLQSKSDSLCLISCKTGEGLNTLMEKLVNKVQKMCGDPSIGSPSLTQSRHRHHLNKCLQHLNGFSKMQSIDIVLAAECLRKATRELGQVTGAVSAEDVLDVIFRDFCIGK